MQDNEDFTTLYTNSRVMRVAAYIILFFAAALFGGYYLGEYQHGLDETAQENLRGAITAFSFLTVYMLWFSFLYERKSFYCAIPAGIAWALMGDTLAIPFWMVTVSLILSLLTQFRSGLVWKSLLWAVAAYCYSDIYSFSPYLLFYGIAVAIVLIGWKVISIYDNLEEEPVSRKNDEKIQSSFSAPTEETVTSSYRPPADDMPAPQSEPTYVQRPEPHIQSYYRPPRDPDIETPKVTPVVRKQASFNDLKSDDYAGILNLLDKKSAALPPALQTELNGLVRNGRLILQSMKDDPEDVKPGTAFLNRYLSAVIRVVEQSERQNLPENAPQSSPVLERCFTALQALHSAFIQQLAQLQENDQLKFDVEMSTLDSLLRTDGFK